MAETQTYNNLSDTDKQAQTNKQTAQALHRRFAKLQSSRAVWESHWQEIADYCLPRKADITKKRQEGDKRTELIFDATAIHAVELLASSLHGMLTNASSPWFTLAYQDKAIADNIEAMEWLQAVTTRMYEAFHHSNFQQEVHELYYDLVTFGTGCIYVESDDQFGLRFSTRHIAEMYITENSRGIVDTIYRKYKLSARAAADDFGLSILPRKIAEAAEKNPLEEFDIMQVIQPREDRQIGKIGQENMPIASVHYDPDTKTILRESGFEEQAFLVCRFLKDSISTYGRSPAMSCLSDVKMLNKMSETSIRAAQKLIDPPLMVPDDGFMNSVRTRPGGLNYYRSGTRDRIEPLQIGANIPVSLNMEEQRRQAIRNAFYVDQLFPPQDSPRKTATQILGEQESRMRIMGPILGRLQAELLQPLISRSFMLMSRQGLFAQAPEFLAGMDLNIRYVSPLAKAQKQGDLESIMRALEVMGQVAQIAPILDHVDVDGLADYLLDTLDVPAVVRKSESQMIEEREQQEAQAQEQAQLQEAMAVAQAAGQAAPALREVANLEQQQTDTGQQTTQAAE